ncbi:MAG: hypothetical protein GXO26_09650 [Crenarchaeota archaeon]|nr:hypothetical protein [Thermoproteota archaeon]
MKNTNAVIKIIEEIEKCHRCEFIDKPYVKYEPYLKYLPDDVRILIVSESPPPGLKDDFIYNLSCRDRLRRVLAYVLNIDDNHVPTFLKINNIFWTTAIKCRPLDRKRIEEMRRNCVQILRKEIEILRPGLIIALGKVAWRSIDEISPNVKIVREYHPLYIWRFQRSRLSVIKYLLMGSGT